MGIEALNFWLLIFEQYATFALSKSGDWADKIMQDKQVVRGNQRVLETLLQQSNEFWTKNRRKPLMQLCLYHHSPQIMCALWVIINPFFSNTIYIVPTLFKYKFCFDLIWTVWGYTWAVFLGLSGKVFEIFHSLNGLQLDSEWLYYLHRWH